MYSLIDYLLLHLGLQTNVGSFHPVYSILISLSLLSILYLIALPIYNRLFLKPFDPEGKHCYVTGGSQGLGKSVAILLAKGGAHVTVVARTQTLLEKAVEEINQARKNPSQRVHFVSASVATFAEASKAVETATQLHGGVAPEYVFTCAGAAKPGLFTEQSMEDFEQSMQLNYFGTLYTIKASVKAMVDNGIKGKLVIVGSVAGFIGMVGYSSYSPTKFALRGLADSLRQELLPNEIDVHYYAPGTIFSPGHETEQKTKPEITKILEEADGGLTPDECARGLLRGIAKNEFIITTDIIGDLFRSATRGISPQNNMVVDFILSLAGWLIIGPYRMYADSLVCKISKKNEKKDK